LEFVNAAFLEGSKEIRRPIGFVFVGIVVEGARVWAVVLGKGVIEPFQVMTHGRRVKKIEHVPLPARRGAFDLLSRRTLRHSVQLPIATLGRPIQRAVGIKFLEQIDGLALG
jgi:hypothetical protein